MANLIGDRLLEDIYAMLAWWRKGGQRLPVPTPRPLSRRNWQVVKITSTTATLSRYPGRIQDYDAEDKTWSDHNAAQDCWVIFANGYTVVSADVSTPKRFFAEMRGEKAADGLPIFLGIDPASAGSGVTGTGSADCIAYWTGASTIDDSVAMKIDNSATSSLGATVYGAWSWFPASGSYWTLGSATMNDLNYGNVGGSGTQTPVYAPLIGLDVTAGANVTITGIVPRNSPYDDGHFFMVYNTDDTYSVTFAHGNAGSSVDNRFHLPGGTNITLAAADEAKIAAFLYLGNNSSVATRGWRLAFKNF